MRPLHVRLVVSDPHRDDVEALRGALRSAGHVVVHDDGAIVPPDVASSPDFVVNEASATPTPESLDQAEARHIAAVLRFTNRNKKQAALLLGIARSTLLAKIRRHHL